MTEAHTIPSRCGGHGMQRCAQDASCQARDNITLDEVGRDPALAATLTSDQAKLLFLRLCAAQTALLLVVLGGNGTGPSATELDEALTVEQAAQRLGVDVSWIYRRSRTLPFIVRLPGSRQDRLRVSARALAAFLAEHQGQPRARWRAARAALPRSVPAPAARRPAS